MKIKRIWIEFEDERGKHYMAPASKFQQDMLTEILANMRLEGRPELAGTSPTNDSTPR